MTVLYPEKNMMGIISLPLTEPSDPLNYKPIFKHCILQTVLHIFLLYFCRTKSFVLKTELYFTFFDLVLFGAWGYSITGSVILVPFYKVIGN